MHRVLSIQSHVVHGYVGNKAATFPLQVLGVHVEAINTVTLSNHPSYPNACKGFRLEQSQFLSIMEGLKNNHLLGYNAVLSGYINSVEITSALRDTVDEMRLTNKPFMYICDPVLGDNERFYVPEVLLDEYKHKLLPLATVITPNFFEAEVLSGVRIKSFAAAVEACRILHDIGPSICILKGLSLDDLAPGQLSILVSKRAEDQQIQIHRIDCERLSGNYSGCGDLFASLFTASLVTTPQGNLGDALDTVATAMNDVLQLTKAAGSSELHILQGIDIYRRPAPQLPPSKRSYVAYGKVAGIIFDLDGTLTLPGAIDFPTLYRRLELEHDTDIVNTINNLSSESERNKKWAIIDEEELFAEQRMELQPNLAEALALLRSSRIRLSIATRNIVRAVDAFICKAQLESDLFRPVISRNCLDGVNKPDPAVARYILQQWQAESGQVWFVGDSIDDMRCGKGAGCKTCLVKNTYNAHLPAKHPELIDFAVDNLLDFVKHLKLQEEG